MKNSESTDSKTPRTKISEKFIIRLTNHDFHNCKIYVFGTFSKEMTILKIKCFLKNFQEAEKKINRSENSLRCSLVGSLQKLLMDSFFLH